MDTVAPPPGPFSVWDIVRVDFPYADTAAIRRRPALMIAAPASQGGFTVLWVLMITSARHTSWPHDVSISALAGTGLSHASVIRAAKTATLDASLAVRIGSLGALDQGRVAANIDDILHGVRPA
jgi:mRNA interferase MazF